LGLKRNFLGEKGLRRGGDAAGAGPARRTTAGIWVRQGGVPPEGMKFIPCSSSQEHEWEREEKSSERRRVKREKDFEK
jgi:hypothetical protein